MKKLTGLFVCLLSYSLIVAQSNFQRHYGQPSNFDEVACLAHTPDGHYLVAGSTANIGAGGLDMLFEKVSADGNTLWQTTWGEAGNDGANHVISLSSGGFLASGYTEGADDSRDFAAIRLDEAGHELWRIVRGGAYNDEAAFALELPDGGFFLAGRTFDPGAEQAAVLLIRTDAAGASLWEKMLSPSSNIEVIGCAPADDGGFFALLRPNLLIKLNSQGDELWTADVTDAQGLPLEAGFFEKMADGQLRIGGWAVSSGSIFWAEVDETGGLDAYYELPNPSGFNLANSLALSSSGKIWLTASSLSGNINFVAPLLYCIDASTGEVLLSRTAAELGISNLRPPYGIYAAIDSEGFLLAGNTFSNAEGENGLLYQADEQGEEIWRSTIGVEGVYGRETARMVIEAADGGFLIAGARPTADEERNLWLIRTNDNGNVQWSADIGSTQDESVAALSARADGSFIVAGYRGDTVIVSAVDDTGTPLWYREYNTGLSDGTFGMLATPDNEVLLAMPVVAEGASYGLLMKLNAQGDSLWGQYYQFNDASEFFNASYGLASSSDGGYILCGCAENQESSFNPFLLKTDAEGNELWSALYPSEGFFNCPITVYQEPDGDIFASGVSLGGGTRPYALRAYPDGLLAWEQSLELAEGTNSYFTWFSARQQSTGRQVLFGRKTFPGSLLPLGNNAGAITALGPDGAVLWEMDYGRKENGQFFGGAGTSDGGLVAVGTATFDNSQDAWLVKTEADGTVGYTAPLAPPFELSLMPNPAEDWLQLTASGLSKRRVVLTLFNPNGQQLHSVTLPAASGQLKHTVNVAGLAPGVYVLHLLQDGKARAVKWVKR